MGEQVFADGISPIVAFLASPDGLRLNRAFVRIADPRQRRKIVELVAAIAGEEETPDLRLAAE